MSSQVMLISGTCNRLIVASNLQNFFRLAAGRKRQHYIAAHDHPQVAVQRLHRMQIERRRSGRT